MEIILSFFLLGLLSIAVCNLFDAKAKVTVIVTILVLVGYIVVVVLTYDLRPLLKAFSTWLDTVSHAIAEKFS